MLWQYRTVLFEFTKDGLLGDKYVDDEEMEKTLNQMGGQGWELVNVTLLQDGVLAFLKKPVGQERVFEGPAIAARTTVAAAQPVINPDPVVATPRVPAVAPERAPESPQPEPEPIRVAERPQRPVAKGDEQDLIGGIRIS